MRQALNFPATVPELSDGFVTLREPGEEDVPAWFERASDAASAALAGDPIAEDPAQGYQWLQRHQERFRQQTGVRWVVVPKGSTTSVGSIGLAINPKELSAELGAVMGRAYWNKGIATAASRLVIRYAFESLGLLEIRAELLQSNIASRHVLEKLGFQLECDVPGFEQSDAGSEDGYRYLLCRDGKLDIP